MCVRSPRSTPRARTGAGVRSPYCTVDARGARSGRLARARHFIATRHAGIKHLPHARPFARARARDSQLRHRLCRHDARGLDRGLEVGLALRSILSIRLPSATTLDPAPLRTVERVSGPSAASSSTTQHGTPFFCACTLLLSHELKARGAHVAPSADCTASLLLLLSSCSHLVRRSRRRSRRRSNR